MDRRRLFFALWPSDRQRETLRDAIQPVLGTIEGRPVERRNWHVTLVFIGDFPAARVAELQAAVAGVGCEPIRLRFDRAVYWARPKIACVEAVTVPGELQKLVDDVRAATAAFDIRPEEHAYRPHITIARAARAFLPQRLARGVELAWSGFELVESESTPRGVQYRPLIQRLP